MKGLNKQQVMENRKKFGSNELTQKKSKSFLDMLKETLADQWLKILMSAVVVDVIIHILGQITGLSSEPWYDIIAMSATIIVLSVTNTFINYKQDRGAQALQREAASIVSKAYRDGELVELPIGELVREDIIYLQPGDMVPVDGVLVEGRLKVDQAALNGESREAEKLVLEDESQEPGDDDLFTKYKVFRGSVVTSGSADIRATSVGDNTILGKINASINDIEDEDENESGEEKKDKKNNKTPSEEKLGRLADGIGVFGYISGGAAAIIKLVSGMYNMYVTSNITVTSVLFLILGSVMLGVTIIIMAVPEGLPLMNTMVQGLNVGKMLKAHIYVKNPKAIETAGYLTHLFTDKTGTLTYGKMTVANVITADGQMFESFEAMSNNLKNYIGIGIGLNNASIVSGDGKVIGSNDTDRALLTYVVENGFKLDKSNVQSEEPFDSRVKYAAITMNDGVKFLKGAPDVIMKDSTYFIDKNGVKQPLTDEISAMLKKAWEAQTDRAMRVIGVVMIDANGDKTFVALVSIRDDVRNDAALAVNRLRKAGVNVTMVTGDVISTAKAIAKDAGLVTSDEDICVTHNELAQMTDEQLIKILPNLKVVARAVPADKERLVKLSQSVGEVSGMTGDGVNDAAALHGADVGFAMGSGTEVAKEAGDIIILNNSLASIADAVLYGRTMSKSVKKFIIFQLTVNVSTVFTALLGLIFGWSEVFTVVQILWINMIMDTLAAIAFGQESPRESYMSEKPIKRDANILNGYLKSSILVGGMFITAICLVILQNVFGVHAVIGGSTEHIRTFMFSTFILAVLWNGLNARTDSLNLFEHLVENHNFILVMSAVALVQVLIIQYGGKFFETTPLSIGEWIAAAMISSLIIPLDLARKVMVKKLGIKA